MTFIERRELFGSHPQSFRYYLSLAAGTFRTALDAAMLVVGTGLVALAAAMLLAGFELVDLGLDLGIGGLLGSALVLGVCGGFALGVASEGKYGGGRSTDGFPTAEVAIGRAFWIVAMALALLWGSGRLGEVVADLPYPFLVGVEVVRTSGAAGFLAAVLGVPAAWGVRRGLDRLGWGVSLEIPTLYLIWLLVAIVGFRLP